MDEDILAALDEIDMGGVEEKSFGDVPDGKYQVKIMSAQINRSKSKGRLQCSWQLAILNTGYRGRYLFKHDGMENEESLAWFRNGLNRLGMEWPANGRELAQKLQELEGSYAQVTARTKEGNTIQNVYFDKALDANDLEEGDLDDGAGAIAGLEGGGDGQGGAEAEAEVETEGEAPEPAAAPAAAAEPAAVGGSVSVGFNDSSLRPPHVKQIQDLATSLEFNPADYASMTDLLCDVAEYVGLSGNYANVVQLIKEAKAAAGTPA